MKFHHVVIAASLALLAWLLSSFANEGMAPPPAPKPADPAVFLVQDVRVFDGERTWPKASVLVRDGRVEAIAVQVDVPVGAQVIDGKGRTLLPGLIDAHTHTWGTARRDALRFGVTTELDMFTDWRQLAAAREERNSLAATGSADLWSAGTLATVPGGHGTEFGMPIPTLSTPAEAPAWVAARKREGSDYIKVVREDLHVFTGKAASMPSLDAPTAAALFAAAHAQGLKSVVHVSAQQTARESLRDGADGLAHLFGDEPADADFVELARSRHAFIVPTLTVLAGFSGESSPLPADPRISLWLTPAQKQSLAAHASFAAPRPELIVNARESVRRLHAAGVTLLAGTDAGNPNTAHGASVHEEMAQLVAAGLQPSQALTAATSAPARIFGLRDRGAIAKGMRADLVLVDGDPTFDIRTTRAIVAIWKNGHRVDRAIDAGTSTAAAATGPVSDFDGAELGAARGMKWMPTSDRMMGGASSSALSRIAGGAQESAGAMRIRGAIAPGSAWPWAGAMLNLGSGTFEPVNGSGWKEVVFQARGDGREYTLMLFSGVEQQAPPSMLRFRPGRDWTTVRLPLAGFAGADLARLRAVGFMAGMPEGEFQIDVDSVEIR
jgi:imidazolonepropionase-like amidohydrolase